MIQRQDKPRNWCNCVASIRELRRYYREAKESHQERQQTRLIDEIAELDYAHSTGRCRFEYDRDEVLIVDAE